jgi:hypothetical protein
LLVSSKLICELLCGVDVDPNPTVVILKSHQKQYTHHYHYYTQHHSQEFHNLFQVLRIL